eukprot:gene2777-4337_t
MTKAAAFLALTLAIAAQGFYIPGVTPMSYQALSPLGIRVNSLTSVQNIMPFEWYSLPFCSPTKEERRKYMQRSQNLGEVLWGDKIEISLYTVSVLVDEVCREVCTLDYDERQMRQFKNRIEQKYRGNMMMDNLPVAEEPSTEKLSTAAVQVGFPLGVPRSATLRGETLINNHLAFKISYHRQPVQTKDGTPLPETYRIVGFLVTPYSIDHDELPCSSEKFSPELGKPLSTAGKKVTWTYSVKWVENKEVDWSTRWDVYLRSTATESRIHWFAIINSLLVVIFLSVVVAIILLRALHKDFNRYNDPENVEEQQEEIGWKLVHTEVFRKPPYALWLAVYVGTGAQLLLMTMTTLIFALFGFLSPANRGALLTALIFLFVLLGSYAGYTAARLLKMFGMRKWSHIFLVGTFFPGQMVLIWFSLNLLLWSQNSASGVAFSQSSKLLKVPQILHRRYRSFLTSGSYAFWLYMYCINYYVNALHIPNLLSSILYFGYMFMVSYFFFVLTGFIGFTSAFIFVWTIYSSIKIS